LLDQLIELLFTHDGHDNTALCCLVNDRDEVLCEAEWRILAWTLENIDQDMAESANKVVSGVLNCSLIA